MMKRCFVLLILLASAIMLKAQFAERLPDMNIPRAGHNVFYANSL